MPTRTISIKLGLAFSGLTLKAQPVDAQGNPSGTAITTGFVDMGDGEYFWTTTSTATCFVIRKASDNSKVTIASFDSTGSSSVSVSVMPINSTLAAPALNEKEVVVFQSTTPVLSFTATDGNGDPVDLEGHDLQFFVFDPFFVQGAVLFTVNAGSMTISGKSVSIPLELIHTATAGRHSYGLRDLTAHSVLSSGIFEIRALASPNG